MDELLDLVNENDEVIGEVWKSEAHSNPKMIHREVAIFIANSKHQVLLQQRSNAKKYLPGYWTVACSGHVGKGEEPISAAHRELLEELGLDVELKFLGTKYKQFGSESRFFYYFFGVCDEGYFTLQKDEVGQVKFFDKDEYIALKKTGKVEELSGEWCEEFWETTQQKSP